MFWHDVRWCYRYNMVLGWKGVEAIKYMFVEWDVWLGFETIGRMIHMSPVIWFECLGIYDDVRSMESNFALLDNYGSAKLFIHLFEDILFNLGDIFKNADLAR